MKLRQRKKTESRIYRTTTANTAIAASQHMHKCKTLISHHDCRTSTCISTLLFSRLSLSISLSSYALHHLTAKECMDRFFCERRNKNGLEKVVERILENTLVVLAFFLHAFKTDLEDERCRSEIYVQTFVYFLVKI